MLQASFFFVFSKTNSYLFVNPFYWTNSGEGKPGLVLDQDQRYKITLKIEGKADRTAKVYTFICPIFRLDKTSLHQGWEKLSENRINGYSI